MPKTAAVFGAGIAGLSAAHELARHGYQVAIYESNSEAGGCFRSARQASEGGMPSEYSWHGMGPWYHNTFAVMQQIPFDEKGSVFDKGLSRPIDFCIAPNIAPAHFYSSLLALPKMFRLGRVEGMRWAWLLVKTWTCDQRSQCQYARLNAAEQWKPLMSETGWKIWRASFGPWIGSDWTNVSLHQAGQFFRKQLLTKPAHSHRADNDGPAWSHGARDGWLLLRGPSNECWFDKWTACLRCQGVQFLFNSTLHKFIYDGKEIEAASLEDGAPVRADLYVLATSPFAAADIIDRTPALASQEQLRLLRPLVQDGPHTQVSFRIAFAERIQWPRARTGVVIADSEFNLTIFAQEQAWTSDVSLGEGIRSLWTGTACVATMPGRVHGLPLAQCTKEQFIDEVFTQLRSCSSLDDMIKQANQGRSWTSMPIVRIEVWHEWLFSSDGIRPLQPKWVNNTHTQPYQPTQATPVRNLVLAGAHTHTQADVWSIEAAVESGLRAVRVIEPDVAITPQYKPLFLRWISHIDNILFKLRAPHVLDVSLFVLVLLAIALVVWAAMALVRLFAQTIL